MDIKKLLFDSSVLLSFPRFLPSRPTGGGVETQGKEARKGNEDAQIRNEKHPLSITCGELYLKIHTRNFFCYLAKNMTH